MKKVIKELQVAENQLQEALVHKDKIIDELTEHRDVFRESLNEMIDTDDIRTYTENAIKNYPLEVIKAVLTTKTFQNPDSKNRCIKAAAQFGR